MKRSMFGIVVAALAVIFGSPAVVEAQNVAPPQGGAQHRQAGIYQAPAYAVWRTSILTGAASGSTSIVLRPVAALRDGYTMPCSSTFCVEFNTNTPIVVGTGSVQETVTPSSVSVGACPPGFGTAASDLCATVTATFSNAHGFGEPVTSGDAGIMEAITDAQNAGGGLVWWQVDTGSVTLSTSGLTTTSTTKVPSQFISFGASARVQTTITTSTNWAVGISGSTSAFCTANATLTAGTTCIANMNSPASVGTSAPSMTAVLITVTGANAGAGAVKARVWGYTAAQANN